MNTVLKIFLSMSVSGGLLILVLLLGKKFLRDRISRQWQYYIWLAVILRLLLPFGTQVNLLGEAYRAVDETITRAVVSGREQAASSPEKQSMRSDGEQPAPSIRQQHVSGALERGPVPGAGLMQNNENADTDSPAQEWTAAHPLQDIAVLLFHQIWLVWLAVAAGLLIRKITIYQSFLHYVNAGSDLISDMETLDRLSHAAELAGVKQPIDLRVNPLISSPLLIGFFRPCIVLPDADTPEKDFQYTALHELIHYRRRDIYYKWLVQITVCLHWFNPLVHLMSREIARDCEFSCDEAVLARMGDASARDYGKTLLDAMAAVGKYRENPGTVTLSENKRLLRERLEAIMKFRERSKTVKILTAMLTLCVVLGAAFIGVYTIGTAADNAQAAGVTMDGKNYYYQGQLVNIFLDGRANGSFHILNMNPAGTVNIRIIRDADNRITGVAYMTDAEAAELLEDMGNDDELPESEPQGNDQRQGERQREVRQGSEQQQEGQQGNDRQRETQQGNDQQRGAQQENDWQQAEQQEKAGGRIWHPRMIPVNVENMADGEIVWLGEYTLSEGDRIWYAVSAEKGNGLEIGFARSGDESLNEVFYFVHNLRQEDEPLECIASLKCGPPATEKPGSYKMFLRAPDGALGNVKGSISIGFKAEAEVY